VKALYLRPRDITKVNTMRQLATALALSIQLAVFTPSAAAQVANTDARREPPGRNQAAAPAQGGDELEFRKSLALSALEKEIGRADTYGKPGARVRVLTLAADVLWGFDEARARKLLRASYSETFKPEFKKSDETDAASAVRLTEMIQSTRADILAVAQRHDPALVEELMNSAVKEKPEDKGRLSALHNEPLLFGSSSAQKRSMARLAASLATTQPAQAVNYALDSLGYGVPLELQQVFKSLIAADAGKAHELFVKASAMYQIDPSLNLYDPLILSSYLKLIPQPERDVRGVRTFLDAAFTKLMLLRERTLASEQGGGPVTTQIFSVLNDLLPFYRHYWPEKAGEVAASIQQLRQEVSPEEVKTQELFPTEASRNDVESILARAEAERSPDNRDALYFQAALSLAKSHDYERAAEVAERARDGELKDAILQYILRSRAEDLISKGRLNEAFKAIEKIDDPAGRADVTVLLVAAARKKGDLVRAREVLEETVRMLGDKPDSAASARAFMWLASSYSTIDQVRGFELMASAIKAANGVRGLDDLRTEPRLLHLKGASRTALQVGESKADFRAGFRALARADFARTISLAETFQSDLLRGLAVVTAADSVLKQKSL
jgi:tetratricopeptide (TPR) repeat protein